MATHGGSTQPLARRLAERAVALESDGIPEDVRQVARLHLLDALGLGLASTTMDYGRAIHRAGLRLGTGDEARVLGFGSALPAASAALVNGTLIHGLDFDDTHIGAIYHATAPALAAALAVGEAEHASGREVLDAYILGIEVGCRIAAAAPGAFHARRFHATGIAGAFAAAAVAGKLRQVDAEVLTSALGICGSQASGILERNEAWNKRMHPGWAAHCGIVAVTMAQAGFLGPASVFEGASGLFASHVGEVPSAGQLGISDLGSRWMTAEVALKPYPCCHIIHGFVDASRHVLGELGMRRLTASNVAEIECPTSADVIPVLTEPREVKISPRTIYDALFSVQYVVGCALAGRPIDLETFYDRPLDDEDVLSLARLVRCPPDEASDYPAHFPGEVTVVLRDGRRVSHRVSASHGTWEDPMTDEEVRTKFLGTAGRCVTIEEAHDLARIVGQVDQIADIGELLEACTPGGMPVPAAP